MIDHSLPLFPLHVSVVEDEVNHTRSHRELGHRRPPRGIGHANISEFPRVYSIDQ